jgi:hypothetical protein
VRPASPTGRPASSAPSRPASTFPGKPVGATPSPLAETPRIEIIGNLADAGPAELAPPAASGLALAIEEDTTDLPPAGRGPRFDLPEAPPDDIASPSGRSARHVSDSLGRRLAADVKSVIELLGWAATTYFRKPASYLLLAAFLVLPASFLQSFLATALMPRPPSVLLAQGTTTAHFEGRKAELAKRIQAAQARGEMDSEAAVALAALTAAEGAQIPLPKDLASDGSGWLRLRLIMLIQGLFVLGLAFPITCGLLAVAVFDRESGAAMPGLADIWPILAARGGLFLITLLPAGLLVALGNALFIIPGLVMSVLFLFLPHVVIFEKKGGKSALSRSIELAKNGLLRSVLVFLSFVLAVAVVGLVTTLLLPTSASRAVAFTHFIACDLLTVVVLPIPALVLARLYLDLRGQKTNAEALSLAARS